MDQQTLIDSSLTIEWLNRLIVMAQLDNKLPFYTASLFAEPTRYQEFLTQVRSGTLKTTPTETSEAESAVVTARQMLETAVASAPLLRELFGAEQDPFDGAPPEHLELLAQLSDITTDPQTMFYSRNGTFLGVVEALRQSRDLETEPLILDWLTKFLTLLETNPTTAEMLFDLAKSDEWYLILASLRDGRDYASNEGPAVVERLAKWNQALTTDLRSLLFKPGNLSRTPMKLVKLAYEESGLVKENGVVKKSGLLKEARTSIETLDKDPIEVRKQVAEKALELFEEKAKEVLDNIQAELKVLATVASHHISVRKFAKLNGLDNGWPELSGIVRTNYTNFEFVEECLVNRKRPSDAELETRDIKDLYLACEKDERLIRFLRLRPYFREIDDDELREYRPLPPVVISEQVQKPGDPVSGADISRAPAPTPPQPVGLGTQVSLEISKKTAFEGDIPSYDVSLVAGDTPLTHHPKFSTSNLINNILAAMGVASEDRLQSTLKEFLASSSTAAESLMGRGGWELQKQVLSEAMQARLLESPPTGQTKRIMLRSDEKELHYLPWEWLSQLNAPGPLLSYKEYSIVRAFSVPSETKPAAIIAPVRLLSIMPSAPSGRRFNSAITVKALEEISTSEPVDYKPLIHKDATLSRIEEELKSFQPHIVHFEGFVVASSPGDTAGEGLRILLSLPDEAGIPIEEFGTLLKEKGVQLLVIGRNGMSRIFENVGANGSFQLIKQGLPALIAPIRAIDDSSATIFTTEFYRAFLQGNSLEAALHVARRRLVSKGGDWSVFALFADPTRLDQFSVLRTTA